MMSRGTETLLHACIFSATKTIPIGFGGTMASTPEQRRLQNQRYREKHRNQIVAYEQQRRPTRNSYINDYRKERRLMRPFIGIDGEGRNLPNGYHAYFMLRAGEASLWHKPIDQRLRTEDILNFLCDLDPDAIYVAYFFDYDVAKILEDLPWTKLDNLVHRERRARNKGGYFPVDWNGYQIEYFPKKEFKVRRVVSTPLLDSDTGEKIAGEYSPWIVVNDTGTFFQSPFITTIRSWDIGTEEEREKIAEGKELRSEFAKITDQYVDEYNALECK